MTPETLQHGNALLKEITQLQDIKDALPQLDQDALYSLENMWETAGLLINKRAASISPEIQAGTQSLCKAFYASFIALIGSHLITKQDELDEL